MTVNFLSANNEKPWPSKFFIMSSLKDVPSNNCLLTENIERN